MLVTNSNTRPRVVRSGDGGGGGDKVPTTTTTITRGSLSSSLRRSSSYYCWSSSRFSIISIGLLFLILLLIIVYLTIWVRIFSFGGDGDRRQNNNNSNFIIRGEAGPPANTTATTTTIPDIIGAVADNSSAEKNNNNNNNNKVWERSKRLPKWMKDYFVWHTNERKKLIDDHDELSRNKNNHTSSLSLSSYKYIIMSCLESDKKCGGTADRLRPLPFLIRLAAQSNRLLFIYWERPFALEEFLVPPANGIDWRLPSFLVTEIRNDPQKYRPIMTGRKLIEASLNPNVRLLRSRAQMNDHGSRYYQTTHQEEEQQNASSALSTTAEESQQQQQQLPPGVGDPFAYQFADCWRTFFTPSPGLAVRIVDEMNRMRIRPTKFGSAHVRANYALHGKGKDKGFADNADGRDPTLIQKWTENALNCLSNLQPGGPYFLASDSKYAKQVAVQYGQEKKTMVVTSHEQKQPFHIDIMTSSSARKLNPVDYFDIFVDLYIMSMGRCMTFNVGGFGRFALQLSGQLRSKCTVVHWTMGLRKSHGNDNCTWKELLPPAYNGDSSATTEQGESDWKNLTVEEIFFPPMR